MSKIKRIRKSKEPLFHQLPIMAKNLSEKLGCSAKIEIETWYHNSGNPSQDYQISLVPGLNNEDCTQLNYKSWPLLLDQYFFLMSRP